MAGNSFAQTHEIDSVRNLLETDKEDTNRVNTLNNLSRQLYLLSDYSQSDSLAQISLALAQKINYKQGMGKAYLNKGNIYEDQGNYTEALKNQLQGLKIFQEIRDKKGMGNAYLNIGNVYWRQGNYPEAQKNYLQSLNSFQEIKNKLGMSNAYGNLGLIYEAQGNYSEALKNQLQGLKIESEIGDKKGMSNAYGNIGNIYDEQGNYTEALKNQLQSLKIARENGDKLSMGEAYMSTGNIYFDMGNYPEALKNQLQGLRIYLEIGNKQGMDIAYGNIGSTYYKTGNYTEALKNQLQGLQMSREIGDNTGRGFAYGNIGNILTQMKKYRAAKQYLDSAMSLSKSIGEKELIKGAYNYWSIYDSATGNYKTALSDYKTYIIYRDSLKNKETDKKILGSQMTFDFERKADSAKAEEDKRNVIHEAAARKQEVIMYASFGGLTLALIFVAIIFRSLSITRRQKNLIEKQKTVVEQQKTLVEQQKELVEEKNKIVEEQKKIVEEKNKDILDSINYAKRLQDAILPPLKMIEQYLPESFVLYKPKDIVAGDFYWMERTESTIFVAAADCTGHGVPGAMVSVVCSNALNRTVKEFKITEPGKILDKVRELVLETFEKSENDVQDGMDISLTSLTPSEGGIQIQWAGAFNSLWYIQDGIMKELPADKQPIGKADNPKPFTTHAFTLKPPLEGREAGTLYLFTDGYADQFGGPKEKKFKYKQLQQLIMDNCKLTMQEQKQNLEQTLDNWKGNLEQVDDVLIIGIRV
ncbi:MAG: tetratricopeptide repeat protein [Bacteroidia bacterium]